jgi:hypothetical protein
VPGAEALLREYPENPVTVMVNGVKQPMYVPAVSRYYFLDSQGDARRTNAMEREARQPMYNILRLPAHSVRVGEEWTARVHISLGEYIPERIEVTARNVVEAIEWELGMPAARIRSTWEWNGKLSVPAIGIGLADCKFKGTSVLHFAPGAGKPVRAVHTIDGDMKVDTTAQQGLGGLSGGGAPGVPGAAPGFSGGGVGPGGIGPSGIPGAESGYSGPGGFAGAGGLAGQAQTYRAKIRATMSAQR